MTNNVGTVDRLIRVVLGVAAAVGALLAGGTSAPGIVLWVVAVILLGTAAAGFCPIYAALRISTLDGRFQRIGRSRSPAGR